VPLVPHALLTARWATTVAHLFGIDVDVGIRVTPMRVVVVGASSGLGRCIGVAFAREGDDVALLARRRELLDQAAEEAGPTARAITCDVTDEAGCRAAVTEAADQLGGIDALVYATGMATLSRLEDIDGDSWARTFATNVTGASIATAAALPHLRASHGVAAYLSSVSASMTAPWPGLGAYVVTKAALDKLVEAWRVEHPDVGFTRLTIGDCAGGEGDAMTQFSAGWDEALSAEILPGWFEKGLIAGSFLDIDDLTRVLHGILRAGASASVPIAVVTPRPPEAPTD
jgi:NAD(P)-dependent dehydrogenase (short-subunit alcohol dehydrogenase family)